MVVFGNLIDPIDALNCPITLKWFHQSIEVAPLSSEGCSAKVAFADRIILNKCDLVDEDRRMTGEGPLH